MIIDESAITVSSMICRIEELERELQQKQELIDKWQLEEYFKLNHANSFK